MDVSRDFVGGVASPQVTNMFRVHRLYESGVIKFLICHMTMGWVDMSRDFVVGVSSS